MVATRRSQQGRQGGAGGTAGVATASDWGKVLYRRQAYADNYTDETFLQSLVRPPPPSTGGQAGSCRALYSGTEGRAAAGLGATPQVLNANAQQRDYWHVVRDSAAVTQQLSAVAAAAVAFVYMQQVKQRRCQRTEAPCLCPLLLLGL